MRRLAAGISALALAVGAVGASAQDRPVDGFLAATKRVAPNREPIIDHPKDRAAAAAALNSAKARFGHAPNIVMILMDDVGWGDMGAFGGGVAVGSPTPNLDRLAATGLRLTSAYSQPSCTPTRASILTGRLPVRTGLLKPYLPGENNEAAGLNGETTLAQLLKQAGYTTQAVGKWHLGGAPSSQPQNVGFDQYYGILTSSDDYTAWREQWRNPDLVNDPDRRAWAADGEIMGIVSGTPGITATLAFPIDLDSVRYVDEKLTDHATKFIASRKNEKNPFFLYFATRGAHFDNYPHPQFAGKSPGRYPYKDTIVELDHRVGQVVEALKQSDQLENTIIMIASDNGPMAETFPDMGTTPFRSAKGSIYEGGVRTPMIVSWPGMIAPGRVSDGLFDLMDVFATSLSLAGRADLIPTDRYIDSIDQTGFLLAPEGQTARRVEYYWATNVFMGARVGEFKYLVRDQSTESDDSWPRSSPFSASFTSPIYGGKMFDLYIDPKEEHALAPLKQPQIPVLKNAINAHLATFKNYPPKVPLR
ncbi:sulfatase-like hydrolase/transferase [Sphingomonas dokdonensis]|uniref:Arylsulfatase n=1 Tax=Sphingomonas dokdonensis TaxID=344880 RepID=A0A245ZTT4_9SPHN|nr:sulfatase-like hydrolase/transferase [Sphingomonas dokdonensis]OWK33147.1 arylsulfatase [Sphingomonas dokdonensis]